VWVRRRWGKNKDWRVGVCAGRVTHLPQKMLRRYMTIVNSYFLVQGARLGKALPAGLAKAVRLFAARLHEADVLCLRGHTPGLGLTADHKSAILYWAEVYDIHQFSIRVHVGTP